MRKFQGHGSKQHTDKIAVIIDPLDRSEHTRMTDCVDFPVPAKPVPHPAQRPLYTTHPATLPVGPHYVRSVAPGKFSRVRAAVFADWSNGQCSPPPPCQGAMMMAWLTN